MAGERPQLYKIRRLIRYPGQDAIYEYLQCDSDTIPIGSWKWTRLLMDGHSWVSYTAAQKVCEWLKGKHRDPLAIYHSVVPV